MPPTEGLDPSDEVKHDYRDEWESVIASETPWGTHSGPAQAFI